MADNWYLNLLVLIRIMVQLARITYSQTGISFKQATTSSCIFDHAYAGIHQASHCNSSRWSESEWGAGKDEWVDSWLPAIQFIKLLSEAMKEW